MTAHPETQELTTPEIILSQSTQLMPTDKAYSKHELVQRFGSSGRPIYVDKNIVNINGIKYDNPLIMKIFDGNLKYIQCAIMQDKIQVSVFPDGLSKGFAKYGDFDYAQPVIITYDLEAFFKIAQTNYAVVLVILPTLCNSNRTKLKKFDFDQIQFVINQLSQAGYKQLYLPVRPEQMQLEPFQKLEQNTAVRLLNQYLKMGVSEFFYQFDKDEDTAEIQVFIDEAIEALPKKTN